jgi:hypothetical protein
MATGRDWAGVRGRHERKNALAAPVDVVLCCP